MKAVCTDGTKLRETRTVSGTATVFDWCGDIVLETDDYYPLGGPLPTGTSTALQPEKYYPHSPYLFCAGNPMKFVDPEGKDVWEINSQGKIVNHIEDKNQDAFYMIDRNGNRIDGKEISFIYGTIEGYESQYSDNERTFFDWYTVRGDENGKLLFEFFAKNTRVEYSQLLLGLKGRDGLNIISTSHKTNSDNSAYYLLENKYKYGYSLRGHNHNHPNNIANPSGLDDRTGDISFSNYLTNISLKNGSGVPTFMIYMPNTGKYIKYNRNSTIYDFPEAEYEGQIPELYFVVPR